MKTNQMATTGAENAEKLRVLIVDDNEASALTIGWMIELLGYDVRLANEGRHAIQEAQNYRPHVVLLDIGLPGMNGYEVCEEMKKIPDLEHTMFIAQTGWGQAEHKERSRKAGFDHHLLKPVELDTLQPLLSAVNAQDAMI